MSGIILIIIIVIVSMVIAYLGDILGKRIGKKRISLFGLRPKHTAIVVTVITGAVIALGTFMVLISLSAPMRRMILETERIYREMKDAKAEKDSLERQAKELRKDAQMLSEQIISIQNDRDKLQKDVDSLNNQIDPLKQEISQRETQLDILANNMADLESKLTNAGKQLADLNTELERTKSEKLAVESAITSLKGNLTKLENDIAAKESTINKLNTEIASKNTEIQKMRTEELAFHEGQRLYGFTINNSLSSKDILATIDKSFDDFKKQSERNLNCTIQRPSPDVLYNVLEKVDSSKASESIILVFAKKNSFKGDSIPIEFLVLDQYIIFKESRILVEQKIDSKLNVLEARDLLGEMIGKAENKALDLGLLRDPYRRMSTFTTETLNSQAAKIEDHRRPMIVRLVAKKDVHRSDYLDENNIKIEIVDG